MSSADSTTPRLNGLIAATLTPYHPDHSINLAAVPPLVELMLSQGVDGFYVNGSTGEGMSLTTDERCQLAEAFVRAAAGQAPVVIQVGHNCLRDASALAAHAQSVGATAISATCPSYFPVSSVRNLVDCMQEIALAAPDLPFYYYHIPRLTGVAMDMVEFLDLASHSIANLAGLKYSEPTVQGLQACLKRASGSYEVLWGVDEMLLSAWVSGARAAVGSTYNFAAPLYKKILQAVDDRDLERASQLQSVAVDMVRILLSFPFHSAVKQVMRWQGVDCGPCRLPLTELAESASTQLRKNLETLVTADGEPAVWFA
ncbi:MAG: dihydrodipicolinate synthase family protein [Planctomycetales bacterium]|nr:dihydrodipicolinate synthase family protein [Planctomycetales bacterium]